jgi:hypothetical protein
MNPPSGSFEPKQGAASQPMRWFLMEAKTWRNERLTKKVKARDRRQAKRVGIEKFTCEGIGILSATVSEIDAGRGQARSGRPL